MKIQFTETQKFSQWWLWLLLIPIGIMPIYGMYTQFVLGESFGSKPMSDTGLIITTIIVFLIIGLFLIMRLTTKIDATGIHMQYVPFIKKNVKWQEIKSAEVVNYGFVGGWGIRLWTAYGTVYNVSGNKGLAIELINGKKFLIGTQKEAELTEVIEKLNQAT
ncbi:hypothetical protein [Kordia jejudonensis]|uniref:hypothetical protein n=1 Tax=Kordia jejudonensis TaxID=1348245 RepID=UPI000628FEC4|nr:hypothetical protein [Kordia jejudonensis]